jgi:hypothetical protein
MRAIRKSAEAETLVSLVARLAAFLAGNSNVLSIGIESYPADARRGLV